MFEMNDYGPLFNAQLDAIRRIGDDQLIGGRIKVFPVKRFETQVGPTCGFVGIRVAAMTLDCGRVPSVEEMLSFCREKNYTKNGECFSADWLAEVVSHFLPDVKANIQEFPAVDEIIQIVLNNEVLLIPYDSDKNFGPSNRNGHAAHWFVVV
jgi:hypothetical protein